VDCDGGAADARYTLDLMPRLREWALPTLLIWGEDDEFQPVRFAERFAAEMPDVTLARIPGARHIPTAEESALVVAPLTDFLASSSSDQPRP